MALKELKEFQKTKAYAMFKEDMEMAEDKATRVSEIIPESIGTFFLREQSQGELTILRQVRLWHETKIEELERQVKQATTE